ncbi:MAG: helix-turn-helix domain-containing protein [Candidatus Omnitrophota bacterium]
MGVVHKLTPEVRQFVLEKKQLNPELSCRKISSLVLDKFQFKLSKSSANAIFKEAGLSLAVGRRRSRAPLPKSKPFIYSGLALFKAADSMFGGSFHISEAIKRVAGDPDAALKTESLLEAHILKSALGLPVSWPQSFAGSLNRNSGLLSEISQVLKNISQVAGGVKAVTTDGKEFYLDGQLHTLWQSSQIPSALSCPAHNLEQRILQQAKGKLPFVLFFAPGFREPTQMFFDFIRGFSDTEKKFSHFVAYNYNLEELKSIKLPEPAGIIFGIWPWQFKEYIKINAVSGIKKFEFAPLKKEFFISAVDVELKQPKLDATLHFNGCLLKANAEEKTGLIVLGSPQPAASDPAALAKAYLEHWPDPTGSFQSFSRKVEASTKQKDTQDNGEETTLSLRSAAGAEAIPIPGLDSLLDNYLKTLELYVRDNLLPGKYSTESATIIKERFYLFECGLTKTKDNLFINFKLSHEADSIKDITYICNQVNEKIIIMPDSRRLWLAVCLENAFPEAGK